MILIRIAKWVLPLVVLGASVVLANAIAAQKEDPRSAEPTETATPVAVIEAERATKALEIKASGTVVAAEQVSVRAEVGGRIDVLGTGVQLGGRLKKDALLLQIDKREYELAVRERRSQIAQARLNITLEEGRRDTAKREWKLLGDNVNATAKGRALAWREPQLKNAKAQLGGSRSSLKRAELAVERTTLIAPFNALVTRETIGPDQVVNPGETLMTLVNSDVFWVQVSIPMSRLAYIDIPGVRGATSGSRVVVRQDLGDGPPLEREGRVLRLLPDLDPVGKMVRVLVAVEDPLALQPENDGKLPLLLGAYVDVVIDGPPPLELYRVPRTALRRGVEVWKVGKDDRLEITSVDIAWRYRDYVLVRSGVSPGDRLINSALSNGVPGMKLTIQAPEDDSATAARAADESASKPGAEEAVQ